jgi:hypothetical protein
VPYKSKAQARAMHAKADAGEIDPSVVKDFDDASQGKMGSLPERITKRTTIPKKKKAKK